MANPRVGKVRVSSKDPPLTFTCWLADTQVDVPSGYGGWNEVTRPWRKPITTWAAPTALHLTLPLMFDGWAEGTSVEHDLAQLVAMTEPRGANNEPPILHVFATGSAIPYTGREWVIGELQWGAALMNTHGNRVRQQVTIVLYEYVTDVYLTEHSPAKRRRVAAKTAQKQAGAQSKRVHAKAARRPAGAHGRTTAATEPFGGGEDLLSIAARELGDADRWVEIAQLNGLRDPRAITPGQVLRLP